MSKWNTVYSNGLTGGKKDFRKFHKVIKNTPSLSIVDLKKQSDEIFAKRTAEEDSLIAAVEAKKAIKPEQIAKVEEIKAARAKAAEKSAKKKDKVEN